MKNNHNVKSIYERNAEQCRAYYLLEQIAERFVEDDFFTGLLPAYEEENEIRIDDALRAVREAISDLHRIYSLFYDKED